MICIVVNNKTTGYNQNCMNWQILVFLSVVFMAFGSVLQRVVMKEDKSDPWAYSIFFQLLVGVIIALFGFIMSDMSISTNVWRTLPNLLLMIVLWAGANYFIYSSLKALEASTFNIIFSGRSLFTALASSVFLGEFLTGKQFVGVIILIFGIAVALFNQKSFRKLDKSFISTVVAAAFFGFANTNDRVLLGYYNLYPYVTLAFVLPAVAMFLLKPQSAVELKKMFRDKTLIKRMSLLALFYSAASATFFSALQTAPNSSQVVAINVSTVILTVLLSIVVLKENEGKYQKIIGAFISFIGLLLVSGS